MENNEDNETYMQSYDEQKQFILSFMEKCQNSSSSLLSDDLNKIQSMLEQFQLPFAFLLLSNVTSSTINQLLSLNDFTVPLKNIINTLIDIFNFEMHSENPAKDIKHLGNNINVLPRANKTKTEELFDLLNSLKTNWEMLLSMKDSDLIKDTIEIFNNQLDQYIKMLNEISINLIPSTFDFFDEFINSIISIKSESELLLKDEIDDDSLSNSSNENIIDINSLNRDKGEYRDVNKYICEIELKRRKYLFLNERVREGEDIESEFKHFNFPFKLTHQEELKHQICSFLNSRGGRIYIGIDDNKQVKGELLQYKMRDKTRNEILNLTYDFYPNCRTSKIDIHFLPIKDYKKQKAIPNLYVIKIIIHQGDTSKLYSVCKKGYTAYIRAFGQCLNLSSEEICEEIIKRKFSPEQQIDDAFFHDEEPENCDVKESIDINSLYDINYDNYYSFNYNKKKKNFFYTVRVSNISMKASTKELEDLFQNSGAVSKNFYHGQKTNRMYGNLRFTSFKKAESVIHAFNGKLFHGLSLKLHLK